MGSINGSDNSSVGASEAIVGSKEKSDSKKISGSRKVKAKKSLNRTLTSISCLILMSVISISCSSSKEASVTDMGPTPNSNPPHSQSATLPVPEALNIAAAGTGCPGGNVIILKKPITGELEIIMPDMKAEADIENGIRIGRTNCEISLEAATNSSGPIRLELIEASLDVEPRLVTFAQSFASLEIFQNSLRGDVAELEIHDPAIRGIHALKTRDLILSSNCGRSLNVRAHIAIRVADGIGTILARNLKLKFKEVRCD